MAEEYSSPTIHSYLERISIFLENKDWAKADEYCEKVLDIEPKNPRAYLGKLMAQLRVSRQEQLAELAQPFNHLDNFKMVVRFGDEELKATLTAYNAHIAQRNAETTYQQACALMAQNTIDGYNQARALFTRIPNYDGVPRLVEECNQKILDIQKNAVYQSGCAFMAQGTINGYDNALCEFAKIPGYKDTAALCAQCEQEIEILRQAAEKKRKHVRKISILTSGACLVVACAIIFMVFILPMIRYNHAVSLMNDGNYDEAIAAFEAMDGYKDSNRKIMDCKYQKAVALMESEQYEDAITIFQTLNNYQDSVRKTDLCQKGIAYNNAVALMEAGNARGALAIFDTLDDYQDSFAQAKLLRIKLAQREAVSAGSYHTVGLKADGTVVAVGGNSVGQCNVSGWRDIIAVSAGDYHTVGLKADGTVVAVGYNDDGRCDVDGWTDIIAVSAGSLHTVGLKADGTVVAAGSNGNGQCDVAGWTDIVAVSAGHTHTIGLKADGTVVAVGNNSVGQCNVAGWTDIVAVCAGGSHTVGLKTDGTVVAVGGNSFGRCDVDQWEDIVAVSASLSHTIGLKADGTVVAAGRNSYGQCDVDDWKDIIAVSASIGHTVGLKANGTVVATGTNAEGQCDVAGWKNIKLPE